LLTVPAWVGQGIEVAPHTRQTIVFCPVLWMRRNPGIETSMIGIGSRAGIEPDEPGQRRITRRFWN
jgi:hypothetical protein